MLDCLKSPQVFNFSFNKKKYKPEKNKNTTNINIVKYKFIYARRKKIPEATISSKANFKNENR